MAIGGSELGDLIGVGPAYNGQFDCTAVVFGGLHAGAGGNDLDGNVWITSNPAGQAPNGLPHRSVAAPSFLHGLCTTSSLSGSSLSTTAITPGFADVPSGLVRMIATGQRARVANAASVVPSNLSAAHPRLSVPTQTRAASCDSLINTCSGSPERRADSTSTGFPTSCTATSALSSAVSPHSTSQSEGCTDAACASLRPMT